MPITFPDFRILARFASDYASLARFVFLLPLPLGIGWRLHTLITGFSRFQVYRHAWRTKEKATSVTMWLR